MSGSAALSAAKRRRGGDGSGPNVTPDSSSPKNIETRPVQINPLQIVNQHHAKLDILYQRQEQINKILNITESEDDNTNNESVNQDSIVGRLEKLENVLEEKISKLSVMIASVQAHSINVSLEVVKLKEKKEYGHTVLKHDDGSSDIVAQHNMETTD